jgi:hypothetical protein
MRPDSNPLGRFPIDDAPNCRRCIFEEEAITDGINGIGSASMTSRKTPRSGSIDKMAAIAGVSFRLIGYSVFVKPNDLLRDTSIMVRQCSASIADGPKFIYQPGCGSTTCFALELLLECHNHRLCNGPPRHLREAPSQSIGIGMFDIERHKPPK